MEIIEEPIENIFCLFHQTTGCTCIYPIVNKETLLERLKHHIRLNNNLNRYERDETKKDNRNQETILFESRLSDLKD